MFNWFKKLFNINELPFSVDYTFSNAQSMVANSEFNNEFLGYHSYLIDAKERPDWCQIVMSKGSHTVTYAFNKQLLYNKDTIDEQWNEVLRPQMLACKNYIDKQMKEHQKYTLELTGKELEAIYKWMGCADDKDIRVLVNKILKLIDIWIKYEEEIK